MAAAASSLTRGMSMAHPPPSAMKMKSMGPPPPRPPGGMPPGGYNPAMFYNSLTPNQKKGAKIGGGIGIILVIVIIVLLVSSCCPCSPSSASIGSSSSSSGSDTSFEGSKECFGQSNSGGSGS